MHCLRCESFFGNLELMLPFLGSWGSQRQLEDVRASLLPFTFTHSVERVCASRRDIERSHILDCFDHVQEESQR